LRRLMIYTIPDSTDDITWMKTPSESYIIYPHFAVSRKGLHYPAVPGVDGILLGEWKTPNGGDMFIRLLNPDFHEKQKISFGETIEKYKFVLNAAYLTAAAIYDPATEATGPYPDFPNESFNNALERDAIALVKIYLDLLAVDKDKIKSDFMRDHMDIDQAGNMLSGTATGNAIFTTPTDIVAPVVLSSEGKQEIKDRQKATSTESIPSNPFVGVASFVHMAAVYKRFMKMSGFNIVKPVKSKSVAVGSMLRRAKLLLKDFKGKSKLATRALKNLEEMESRLQDTIKGLRETRKNITADRAGLTPSISEFSNTIMIDEAELASLFSTAGKPSSKFRMKVPDVFADFFLNRAKSIKNVIKPGDEDKFVIMIYYPIALIYMNFYTYVGMSSDDFQYKKFMQYVTDYFQQTLKKRGNFIILEDKQNFYKRVTMLIKNFV